MLHRRVKEHGWTHPYCLRVRARLGKEYSKVITDSTSFSANESVASLHGLFTFITCFLHLLIRLRLRLCLGR